MESKPPLALVCSVRLMWSRSASFLTENSKLAPHEVRSETVPGKKESVANTFSLKSSNLKINIKKIDVNLLVYKIFLTAYVNLSKPWPKRDWKSRVSNAGSLL